MSPERCAVAPNARSSLSPGTSRVNEASRRYVNRLSDYLFVAARILARAGSGEVYWKHERSRGSTA